VSSRQPFLGAALLERGYNPATRYNMRHANSDVLSFVTTTVGHAVGLSVNDARTRFQKFAPFEGPNDDRPCPQEWATAYKGSTAQRRRGGWLGGMVRTNQKTRQWASLSTCGQISQRNV
jgi:hypothetical protein